MGKGQKMVTDYTLCLVTDRQGLTEEQLITAAGQAIAGGCTMIQLREKDSSTREFHALALRIKQMTDRHDIPLIINDRADIALAAEAAGLHIGQSDLPARAARRLLGKERILGVSVTSVEEALRAAEDGADYLGVGAMFPSSTKKDAVHVGIEEFCRIRQAVSLPLMVIGGINKENAGIFRRLGADGLAVVSAILDDPSPSEAAARIRKNFIPHGLKM